jgi:hypothetical protein
VLPLKPIASFGWVVSRVPSKEVKHLPLEVEELALFIPALEEGKKGEGWGE